jgi:cold shock CspA family protein
MAAGSLKCGNADRGFGFIKDDSGGPDIFMRIGVMRALNRHAERVFNS